MPAEFFMPHFHSSRIAAQAVAFVVCGGFLVAPVTAGEVGSHLDACKMLEASGLEEIIGAAHDGGTLLFEKHEGETSFSQCQFASDSGDRMIGLAILRAPNGKAPASRQGFIDQTRADDMMGAGEETAAALEAGSQVPGLGELALTYDLFSFNLLVWNGNYQLTLLLDGFVPEEAETHAISVAQSLLGQL